MKQPIDNINFIHSSVLEIPIIQASYELYLRIHKIIFSLPKFERFSIGEKIENQILSIIELVTEANTVTKYEKERYLIKANGKNECLKILIRLCLDMKIIEFKTYVDLEKRIQEIGKQTQGWIKYTRANK